MEAVGERPRLKKLLFNVIIQGDFVAVRVVMPSESTVSDLVGAAVKQYIKEGRRPLLTRTDSSCFSLHYSQFNFESLETGERLTDLESRNLYLCQKRVEMLPMTSFLGCSEEEAKASRKAISCFNFIDF